MAEPTIKDLMDRIEVLTNALLSNKPTLNMDEASAYTGISKSMLYKLTHEKKIPHYKPFGKLVYFKRDDLDAVMLKGRVKTQEEIADEAARHVIAKRH